MASGERGQKISDRDEYLEPTRQLVVPYRNKTKHGGRGFVYVCNHVILLLNIGSIWTKSFYVVYFIVYTIYGKLFEI